MDETYMQSSDAMPSGSLARPAPPGRRRTSSRNVSRTPSTASPRLRSDSPSTSSAAVFPHTTFVTMEDGDASSSKSDHTKIPSLSLPSYTDSDSEIPLEEVEVALAGMSREDLVLALKRAKEQMDLLDSQIDSRRDHADMLEAKLTELASQMQKAEEECRDLRLALRQREDRVDELLRDQDREEDEVYASMALIERLRKRVEEGEKGQAEMEKRYLEHIQIADKERQSFLDMESLLRTQKAKASTVHERLQNSNQELTRENERLQVLVSQLRRGTRMESAPSSNKEIDVVSPRVTDSSEDSDSALAGEGIRNLQMEVKDSEFEAMQAELLTMAKSQDMLAAQIRQYQTELTASRASNAELRDQNEAYMNILQEKTFNGALMEESSMLNGENHSSFTSDGSGSDDMDDVPDEPKRSRRKRALAVAHDVSQENLSQMTNLASELESVITNGNSSEYDAIRRKERRREKSEALGNDIDELHKEIRTLRESNQALTLYVNKILDRIISVEGYENVLSADGDNKSRMGSIRGGPDRKKSQRFRQPVSVMNKSQERTPEKKTGGGMLSFISPTSDASDTKTAMTKDSSKAKRTASYDWRSLLGGASTTNNLEVKSNDTPRKISSSEEVEDAKDVEEKEKIRRSMMTAGIALPDNQLKTQKRASAIGTFFTRVLGTSLAPTTGIVIKEEPDRGQKDDEVATAVVVAVQNPSHLAMGGEHNVLTGAESKPVDLLEARQKALELGSNGNLTEAPHRSMPLSSRREKLQRSETLNGIGETTFESVGGDESFRIDSPPSLDRKTLTSDSEEEKSWGRTFKRMSILNAKVE